MWYLIPRSSHGVCIHRRSGATLGKGTEFSDGLKYKERLRDRKNSSRSLNVRRNARAGVAGRLPVEQACPFGKVAEGTAGLFLREIGDAETVHSRSPTQRQ
jgi:hypothetical protein